jgi:hypothetical protein
MTQKTAKKWTVSYMIIKRLILKKEPREGLALNRSFQAKKKFDFILYCGRMALEILHRTHALRKTKKHFSFFRLRAILTFLTKIDFLRGGGP